MQKSDANSQYLIVASAIGFITRNARQQPSLSQVAEAVQLSEFHLQRVFTQWAGISPKRFLQFLTKEHAKRAIAESSSVLDAALTTGLSGSSRLHDLMISCEAMTPGEIKSAGAGVAVSYGWSDTPFGIALFAWTARGVCYLAFCDQDLAGQLKELRSLWSKAVLEEDDVGAGQLSRKVFPRAPQSGTLHLVLRGTNFQIKVWEALLNTSPGQLLSYSQLAHMSGSAKAQRAVGSAVAANSIAYLIPCHRVIRESGETGNYRWGVPRKHAIGLWETRTGL